MVVNGLTTTEFVGNGTEIVMTVLTESPSLWDTVRAWGGFAFGLISAASTVYERVTGWLYPETEQSAQQGGT